MKEYDIDAIPYSHKELDAWRDSLRRGIKYLHEPTNLIIRGGIDDVWVNPKGELHIVDYKATAKTGEVSLDAEWQDGYKLAPGRYVGLADIEDDGISFEKKMNKLSSELREEFVRGRELEKEIEDNLKELGF